MKIRLAFWQKILLTLAFAALSIVGFMVKLPATFRHVDKEMHSLFYFLAAAFLNILFAKRNLLIHALIFGMLYAFGVAIEYAQQYSNTYFHSKIHGNVDPEDIRSNLEGLIAFSALWVSCVMVMFLYKKVLVKEPVSSEQQEL